MIGGGSFFRGDPMGVAAETEVLRLFRIRCSDGWRTFCLLCADIAKAISAHIRHPVREQPDTEYWKSLLSYVVTALVY